MDLGLEWPMYVDTRAHNSFEHSTVFIKCLFVLVCFLNCLFVGLPGLNSKVCAADVEVHVCVPDSCWPVLGFQNKCALQ